jgi:IS4 transposase
MDVPSKNPGEVSDATEGFDVTSKAVSFGYFSLGQQRKVTRRQAEAVAFNDSNGKAGSNSNIPGSAPGRR